jgi:very-short-patch-repair endonuclease
MLTEPFLGSVAVADGLVTEKQLRGPRFSRLFRDVYVAADVTVDLALRSKAAHLAVGGRGVLGGWSAAELLGASCGPAEAAAEVVVRWHQRGQPALRVRHEALLPDEITRVRRWAVTTPLRTAYDLARRESLVDAVVAVDALARAHPFPLGALLEMSRRHLGARGTSRLPEVLRWANPLAESPMETRIRLAIVRGGLPVPTLQHPVGPFRLDMAYPAIRLGIEYDGREHLNQERALRDLDRQAYLTAAGWTKVLRMRAWQVHRPGLVASLVRDELILAGRRLDLTLAEVIAMIDPMFTSRSF